MGCIDMARTNWRLFLVVVTPLGLCPLIVLGESQDSKCAFVLCLCAIFYVTEALPLPITGLLGVALFPLLGVMPISDACKVFFGDISFLLMGGVLVATAIENSNLHRRVALKLILLIGVQPQRLLFTMMVATAFMSMWISNTASFAMMIPITRALLKTLLDARVAMGTDALLGTQDEEGKHKDDSQRHANLVDSRRNGTKHSKEEIPESVAETVFSPEDDANEVAVANDEADSVYDRNTLLSRETSQEKKEDDDEEKEEVVAHISFDQYDAKSRHLVKMFCFGVCYAANCGGISTLIGSPPNMVVAQVVNEIAQDGKSPLTFVNWASYGTPVSYLTLSVCYLWISVAAFGLRNTFCCKRLSSNTENSRMRETVVKAYRKLGSIKFVEKVVMVHFLVLVGLWLTRKIGTKPGWAIVFQDGYVSDGMAAMAVALSLFIFPSQRPNVLFFRSKTDTSKPRSMPGVLTWGVACKHMQWGLILLIGSGMVIAKATQVSGLSKTFANNLSFLSDLPPWLTTLILITLTCFATEITSNTVITMLLMPVVSQMAITSGLNPLLYMIPVGVSASYAFMLPVGTAPNAMLYSLGEVTTMDFIKTGFVMNILAILVATGTINTLGYAVFSFGEFPSWLKVSNMTSDVSMTT